MTEHKPPIQAFEACPRTPLSGGRHLPPCWLYHSEHEAGIFNTEAEVAQAFAEGWRDSPAAAEAVVEALPEIFAPIAEQPVLGPIIVPAIIEAMPDDGVEAALEAAEACPPIGAFEGRPRMVVSGDAIEGSYERPRSGQVPAQKAPYGGTAEQGGARRVRKKRKR